MRDAAAGIAEAEAASDTVLLVPDTPILARQQESSEAQGWRTNMASPACAGSIVPWRSCTRYCDWVVQDTEMVAADTVPPVPDFTKTSGRLGSLRTQSPLIDKEVCGTCSNPDGT